MDRLVRLVASFTSMTSRPCAGEVVKALWTYIKEKDLQNPENKKVIMVKNDEKLHAILGVDKCEGFSMSKCTAPSDCSACASVFDVCLCAIT
jgi:chromatin remodeling complex protein RSC6